MATVNEQLQRYAPGRDLSEKEKSTLEGLIDSAGLCAVLQGLSTICDEKAEHILANWSDKELTRKWASAAGVIGLASTESHVVAIGRG